MRHAERYGRAEKMLRAKRRRLAAAEKYETGEFSAGPQGLQDLAAEVETIRYGHHEKAPDLDTRITAALGEGWDEGPEPDPCGRRADNFRWRSLQ